MISEKEGVVGISLLESRAALVVLDLQQAVMARATRPHTAGEVLERSVRLAQAFRASARPVILVRTIGAPRGRNGCPLSQCREVAPPSRWSVLDPRLTAGAHHVATKQAWGAMHTGAGLPQLLSNLGIVQVVLTGIATSMAVESTARSAHDDGYHVVVVTDATSDLDARAHLHCVEHTLPQLGETGTTDDVLRVLGGT